MTIIRSMNITYITAIILFILACVKDILVNCIVFAVHKKVTKIEVDSKVGLTITACFAKFLTCLIIWLMVVFDTGTVIFAVFQSIASPIHYKLISILISTVFIFCYDYFFLLPHMQVSKKHKLLLALLFTILNAPCFVLSYDIGYFGYSLNLF